MCSWIVDLYKLPTLLVVAALGSNMLMQWNASIDNVSVYYIYRNGVRIGSRVAANYTDPAAQPNMHYSYTVSASDAGGNEPSRSLASAITTGGGEGGGVEVGPSAALFARPYYTCTRNFYVATNGNDSRTVAQAQNPATPWLTIQHADDSKALTAGDCVNIAPGTYSSGVMWLRTGGNTASPSGYVVYRSSTMGGAHFVANTSARQFFHRGV